MVLDHHINQGKNNMSSFMATVIVLSFEIILILIFSVVGHPYHLHSHDLRWHKATQMVLVLLPARGLTMFAERVFYGLRCFCNDFSLIICALDLLKFLSAVLFPHCSTFCLKHYFLFCIGFCFCLFFYFSLFLTH